MISEEIKALIEREADEYAVQTGIPIHQTLGRNGFRNGATIWAKRALKLREALKAEMETRCQHPNLILTDNSKMDRDWCALCGNWIYRNAIDKSILALVEFDAELEKK